MSILIEWGNPRKDTCQKHLNVYGVNMAELPFLDTSFSLSEMIYE